MLRARAAKVRKADCVVAWYIAEGSANDGPVGVYTMWYFRGALVCGAEIVETSVSNWMELDGFPGPVQCTAVSAA